LKTDLDIIIQLAVIYDKRAPSPMGVVARPRFIYFKANREIKIDFTKDYSTGCPTKAGLGRRTNNELYHYDGRPTPCIEKT
jgi:hypothetical protein